MPRATGGGTPSAMRTARGWGPMDKECELCPLAPLEDDCHSTARQARRQTCSAASCAPSNVGTFVGERSSPPTPAIHAAETNADAIQNALSARSFVKLRCQQLVRASTWWRGSSMSQGGPAWPPAWWRRCERAGRLGAGGNPKPPQRRTTAWPTMPVTSLECLGHSNCYLLQGPRSHARS